MWVRKANPYPEKMSITLRTRHSLPFPWWRKVINVINLPPLGEWCRCFSVVPYTTLVSESILPSQCPLPLLFHPTNIYFLSNYASLIEFSIWYGGTVLKTGSENWFWVIWNWLFHLAFVTYNFTFVFKTLKSTYIKLSKLFDDKHKVFRLYLLKNESTY